MKYSSYNWATKPGPVHERGWIIGPFFGRTLRVMWFRKR